MIGRLSEDRVDRLPDAPMAGTDQAARAAWDRIGRHLATRLGACAIVDNLERLC